MTSQSVEKNRTYEAGVNMSENNSGRRINPEKAKKAASNPDRPGEKCRAKPGKFVPVINQSKCEGKRDCVEVCPYNVFEVRKIDEDDFQKLSFFAKMKSRAHGKMTAYTPRADLCQACGLCVVACPEKAITLKSPN
jgi:NAD-dependent dihydropyrimidine dehydrogenase PreA subunit